MAKFFFLSHLYFTTLPPIAPSMCLKRDVFRAFTSTLSDVKVAYFADGAMGHMAVAFAPAASSLCRVLQYLAVYTVYIHCFPWLEKKRFFAILDFQDTVFLAQF